MVSCRMFMPALHTIWRFCLFRTCGVRECLSGLRAETPCVPPPLRGTQGSLFARIVYLLWVFTRYKVVSKSQSIYVPDDAL